MMLECAVLKSAFLLMPFFSQSQGGHTGISLIRAGCEARSRWHLHRRWQSLWTFITKHSVQVPQLDSNPDCGTACWAPGQTHLFLCFCCMCSDNCYKTAFYTELCRTWELLEELLQPLDWKIIWVMWCAACVLCPPSACGTNDKKTNFISCVCMRYPSSLSLPCTFPLQILMLLTEPACSQTGGSPMS